MTRPSPPIDYWIEQLDRNPARDAAAILAERRRAFGLATVAKPTRSYDDMMEKRAQARQWLDELRSRFWTAPIDQLRRDLESFDTSDFPEMEPARMRLRLVAGCRGEFARLASDASWNRELFTAFKSSVILPAAEAGPIKEQFLATLKNRSQLKQVKQCVQTLRATYPTLYELDCNWFDDILGAKAPRELASLLDARDRDLSRNTDDLRIWNWFLLICTFLILLTLLLTCLVSNE